LTIIEAYRSGRKVRDICAAWTARARKVVDICAAQTTRVQTIILRRAICIHNEKALFNLET